MICSVCHRSNDKQAKFCDQCGEPLDMRCAACGHPVRPEARFCSECGQPLVAPPVVASQPAVTAAPPSVPTPSLDDKLAQLQRYVPQHLADKILANRGRLEGERKLVTVLFADIAGYTALSEQLGEEALFTIMDELYELFIHEVHRYEGTVNELTGDGLVAFFGAPLAVEQAPQRAVWTALALQEAAARFSGRLTREHDSQVQLRIGINTGPVIVGTIGNDLRMDYKAVGSTVNLAARMEQTATPGSIRITAQTYKLVEGYFNCEDLGATSVKGATTKVRVYRITGARDVHGRIDVARDRGFTRLAGRQHELNLLHHCIDLVQDGHGQAVSIIGDAGLGKSRLLHEYRQALASEDLTWLDGRCSPYGTALAYLPIVDLLKQHFRIDDNDSDADIRRKVYRELEDLNVDPGATAPYLLHVLAVEVHDGIPSGLSPETLKYRIFEALRTVFLESAVQRPLVVVIEDLHWIDRTTEDFITFLLDYIAASHILLVFTYRPDFASTWSRKSYHNVITLTRLAHNDSYHMLTSLLGSTRIQDDLATLVLDKAEGVPFFIEELVQSLRETGAITVHEGAWRLTAGDTALQIPDTVDEVLMARIDRLPEGAKSVLQLGAVIGREFSGELLREIAGLVEHELTTHLAALAAAELIYERGLPPHTTYLFKHAFTQEAAYGSLLTARRRDLHHRVAMTIEALFPDRLEEHYGQLAYHYNEASPGHETNKAIEYAIRAGERNMALPAFTEAARFYQMALDAMQRQEPVDEALRCRVLLELAEAHYMMGSHLQAIQAFQLAADLARTLGSAERLAHAVLGNEKARSRAGLPKAEIISLLEEALHALPEDDSPLRTRVLSGLSSSLYYTGMQEQAETTGQQAIEMAYRIGDAATLSSILHQSFWVFRNQPEKIEELRAYADDMLRLGKEVDDGEDVLNAHVSQILVLVELGEIQALDAHLAVFTRLAQERQHSHHLYMSTSFQVMRALLDGRFEAAGQLAQQALDIGQRLQAEGVDGTFGVQMFTLCREQGRLRELAPVVKQFVQRHGAASAWRPGLALIYSELGRERDARAAFEQLAAHDFADFPQDNLWTTCMVYLAEVSTFLGDVRRAAILYQLLNPYAGHNLVFGMGHVSYGPASRYLGLLATTMRRWDEAEQHLEDALAMNDRMGARPWLAHTRHDYAAMLLMRNRPGDGDTAMALLDAALSTARELGMRALADRIAARTGPATTPPLAPLTDLDDLSPRELEVLHLIAAGKSNREIADTLFISLNTVATHVRNILTKTDCANRTEAAAYAMRHGLSET